MKYPKHLNIIIVVLLILSVIYAVASTISYKKRLTILATEIQNNVETLDSLRNSYDDILDRYIESTKKLSYTEKQLNNFKNDIDSIMHSRKQSVSQLNVSLESIIERQNNIVMSDTTQVSFRLK